MPATEPLFQTERLKRLHIGPLDFCLRAGDILGVVGASGTGKSQLLRSLADLEIHEGSKYLRSRPSEDYLVTEWRRRVQMVPAEGVWWYPTAQAHFTGDLDPARLEKLKLRPDTANRPVQELSTGERARWLLLRAMQHNPDVLLLDEPTASLDDETERATEGFLQQYLTDGERAIIWVSHSQAQLERLQAKTLELNPPEVA